MAHNRGSFHDSPDFALVIALDNGMNYNVEEESARVKLSAILGEGDHVIIYYPTEILRILSVGYARDVSQVERNSQVLYSWKEQQTEEWFVVGMLAVVMALFYWMKVSFRDSVEAPTL